MIFYLSESSLNKYKESLNESFSEDIIKIKDNIDLNKELLKYIKKYYNLVKKDSYKFIDNIYDEWYKDKSQSIKKVKELYDEFLDYIEISKGYIKNSYCIYYWSNSKKHKNSDLFFEGHSISSKLYIDRDNYELKSEIETTL